MKKYGETMRQIRRDKGYTMKELADGIMSVSFLSKFERGQSDITLNYFVQLLERLAVTFDEFFFIYHHYELDNMERFFNQAEEAYTNRDIAAIKRLRIEEREKWQAFGWDTVLCNILLLDVYESIISNELMTVEEESLTKLKNYLFKVEVWGYYELRLYNSTMLLMPSEMVIMLSKTAYEKSARYRGLDSVNKLLLPILMNTVTYLTGGQGPFKYHEEVHLFLSYLSRIHIPENDLASRNSLLQIKGIYEIRKGNREKGIAMVERALTVLDQLNSHQSEKQLRNYLDIVLDK